MKNTILTFLLFFITGTIFSQTPAKYWVQFKEKDTENYSVKTPERFLSLNAIEKRAKLGIPIAEEDIPVSRKHIATVLMLDSTAVLLTTSKWHNGATFYSENPDFITVMNHCDIVRYVEQTFTCKEPESFILENINYFNENTPKADIPDDLDYGYGTKQIQINNIHWLHRLGFKGEGVLLQVQDGGFRNSDSIRHFRQHFEDQRVRGVFNFVQPAKSTFRDGSHGTGVWSCIASYLPGVLVGSAPACSFYLVQTEDPRTENVIEEDNWVAGLEFADSLGIDILTSSLGYTTFDDSTYYRSYSSLNGQTSRASLAADIAVSKGMIVVNSAGNAGRDKWHYIGVPADANHVLSIGAVNTEGKRAPFSSYGPTFDGRVKPDGAAVGWNTMVATPNDKSFPGSGTSYAAPIFAGMVACLIQAFPDRTNFEIIDAVRKSGNQYATPDSALGYGITDFLKAYNLLLQPENKNLDISFNTFVIHNKDKNISFNIATNNNTKITITYGLRDVEKKKSKNLILKLCVNKITLPIPKLPKNRKYDFLDIKIDDGETEYHYVLGRE
ncbi:MAG: S8 family serine peptidase [Bacteroidetes bacterium]|nr:S8 family serine peptidase [Bacteroidota bacterium]MCL1968455.1 S8 family serine peptidase [Bacteroidota bacterium]